MANPNLPGDWAQDNVPCHYQEASPVNSPSPESLAQAEILPSLELLTPVVPSAEPTCVQPDDLIDPCTLPREPAAFAPGQLPATTSDTAFTAVAPTRGAAKPA